MIKYGVMALRVFGLITLILGVLIWFNVLTTSSIHMLFGILVVLSLWAVAVGVATAPKGRNIGLASGIFVLGLILPIIGMGQSNWLVNPSVHWIIQVIHLLFGLAAIGVGEMVSARYRRLNKVA